MTIHAWPTLCLKIGFHRQLKSSELWLGELLQSTERALRHGFENFFLRQNNTVRSKTSVSSSCHELQQGTNVPQQQKVLGALLFPVLRPTWVERFLQVSGAGFGPDLSSATFSTGLSPFFLRSDNQVKPKRRQTKPLGARNPKSKAVGWLFGWLWTSSLCCKKLASYLSVARDGRISSTRTSYCRYGVTLCVPRSVASILCCSVGVFQDA